MGLFIWKPQEAKMKQPMCLLDQGMQWNYWKWRGKKEGSAEEANMALKGYLPLYFLNMVESTWVLALPALCSLHRIN